MTGIFKANNPSNNLLLVLYALVLKSVVFTTTYSELRVANGSLIYQKIIQLFDDIATSLHWWYGLIIVLLHIIQALHINNTVNKLRLFAKPNYLAGMSYLLFSSLVPQWLLFSPHLLAATLIIWCFARLPELYNSPAARGKIFNIGMVAGFCYLLDASSILFIILPFSGLFIFRAFRLNEWALLILGIATPLYFFFSILYLNDVPIAQLPILHFYNPARNFSIMRYCITGLILLHIFVGLYFINDNLSKQVVQIRNTWKLSVFMLLISVASFFLVNQHQYVYPIFFAAPVALFSAALYYYIKQKWLVNLLHLSVFILAVYIAYFA